MANDGYARGVAAYAIPAVAILVIVGVIRELAFSPVRNYAVAALVARLIWELAFSPLRKFRGPLAARFTHLWRVRAVLLGNAEAHHRQWHRRYGTAVRVGPDAVMLDDPDLIKTIYTGKNAWKKVG